MTLPRSTTMRANGAPPDAAAALYSGAIMHHRMRPVSHRFSYKVFSLLIDLDRLKEASKLSRLFSVGSFNLLAFHPKDHGPRDGSSLRAFVEQRLAEKELKSPARILLLAYPRILGAVFNPLAIYYTFDSKQDLTCMIYEVRNTFGEIHHYTIPVTAGQLSDAGLRQDQGKDFFVSPFINMDQHYHFSLLPPGRSVRIRILEKDEEGPLLSATFHGDFSPLRSGKIALLLLHLQHQTLRVLIGIHWQAFKIWRKGVGFHNRNAKLVPDSSVGTSGYHKIAS